MTKEEIGDLIEQLQSEHYAQGMDADDYLIELVNRAIAIERERIIKANAPEIEKVNAYIKALEEPVAWIEKDKDYLAVSADPFENAIPVYTTLPKREWVGLTEDEFEKILETHNQATTFAVYLNIEAKLKEKNT